MKQIPLSLPPRSGGAPSFALCSAAEIPASAMPYRKLCAAIACLTLLAISLPASSAALTLVIEPPPGTNQGDTDTCVIASTNCPQNLIAFTNFGNSATEFAGVSPEYFYTPGQSGGLNFGFTRFDIAIDSGSSDSHAETLTTFLVETKTAGSAIWETRDSFLGGLAGNIGIPQNNGNGFSDYLLQTVDLTSLASGSYLRFSAVLTSLSGGPESFFVKVVEARVAEPGSLALLGLGMVGLGIMLRPRSRLANSAFAA